MQVMNECRKGGTKRREGERLLFRNSFNKVKLMAPQRSAVCTLVYCIGKRLMETFKSDEKSIK